VSAPSTRRRARGFTLIEVMVAVIVIAIGLLGIAKIQALSFASTGVASMRSLAALEASSLAGSMHADRAYWAGGTAATGAGITVTGTTISDANLSPIVTCTTATATPADCAPLTFAAYDLQQWAAQVNTLLPNPVSNIVCTNVAGVPVSCTITITWSENTVAVNNQGTAGGMQAPTYVLYVEP